jgi:CO/xanthine dehydrogenase Mo-binding subunit
VHPTLAELQCEGNVAFGISASLFEELVIADGQVANPNLSEYQIASLEDMPKRLRVQLGEAGERLYGVGETALPAIAPAIANAVYAACGARVRELPLTPERVLDALRS